MAATTTMTMTTTTMTTIQRRGIPDAMTGRLWVLWLVLGVGEQ
jgi:hypothetical protein